MRMIDFARANRLPFTWRDPAHDAAAAAIVGGLDPSELPVVRLPGGAELHGPSTGQVSRALGIGRELAPREEVDLLVVGAGPAGLGAAVYGASEGLDTLVVESTRPRRPGGLVAEDRELPRLPGRHQRDRAHQPRRHPGAEVRRPHGDALPRGRRSSRATGATSCGWRRITRSSRAPSCSPPGAQYRRLPVEGLADYEGMSVFYAAGPPEAQLCGASRVGVVGGGNSAGQAAVWLARGGALVTLLHRRADLRETMSDYLVRELERYGVAVRDRSEIAALHGERRAARGRHAHERRAPAASRSCSSSSARARAPSGSATRSRATRTASSSPAPPPAPINLLETSVPGVFAAGDVRSGSTKRCATAVGEGAMAVQLVHARLGAGSGA